MIDTMITKHCFSWIPCILIFSLSSKYILFLDFPLQEWIIHRCFLFNFQVFGDCPFNCFLVLWSGNTFYMILVHFLVCLWPRIYSLLVTMPHSLEKNAYSILGWILNKVDPYGCWYFSVLHPCWFSSTIRYWVDLLSLQLELCPYDLSLLLVCITSCIFKLWC